MPLVFNDFERGLWLAAQLQFESKPILDVTENGFTGVIIKTGEKLVLLDTNSKTSYQLDDQEKAQDFVNKNVN